MGEVLITALTAMAICLAVIWLLLIVVLLVRRPDRTTIETAARLPLNVLSLARNLLGGDSLPRGAKIRLWLLVVYLASPIDLIPDFFPVIGYADDVIVTALLLRGVARAIGGERLRQAWSGDEAGFSALAKACGFDAGY